LREDLPYRCKPEPAKTVKLAPEHAICALARLGQDLTYGIVRFDLPETARGHICHILARFSTAQVCNGRVNKTKNLSCNLKS
jgi:hypothetical protein